MDIVVGTTDGILIMRSEADGTPYLLQEIDTPPEISAVVTGDINGDEIEDVVALSAFLNQVLICLSQGSDSLELTQVEQVGPRSAELHTGFIDGDNSPDIAVASAQGGTLHILLNNGAGSYASATSVPAKEECQDFCMFDLNDDGITDFLLTIPGSGEAVIVTSSPVGYDPPRPFHKSLRPFSIGCTVSNGNEAVLITDVLENKLYIYSVSDLGELQPGAELTTGETPSSLVLDDVTGDGISDAIVTCSRGLGSSPGTRIDVFRGLSEGSSYSLQSEYSVGQGAYKSTTGDVNQDLVRDVITVSQVSKTCSIAYGGEDIGVIAHSLSYDQAWRMEVVRSTTGENRLAIAGIESGVVSLLRREGLTLSIEEVLDVGSFVSSIGVSTSNLTPWPMLVVGESSERKLSVFVPSQDGTYLTGLDIPVGSYPADIAVGELTGDAHEEIVVALPNNGKIAILDGRDDGTFEAPRYFSTGAFPLSVDIGDLDNDGRGDVLTANCQSQSVTALFGLDGGGFQQVVIDIPPGCPLDVRIVDLNGDALLDFLVSSNRLLGSAASLSVLLQVEGRQFVLSDRCEFNATASELDVLGRTGDGSTVVALCRQTSSALLLAAIDGAGHISSSQSRGVCDGPRTVRFFPGATETLGFVTCDAQGAVIPLVLDGVTSIQAGALDVSTSCFGNRISWAAPQRENAARFTVQRSRVVDGVTDRVWWVNDTGESGVVLDPGSNNEVHQYSLSTVDREGVVTILDHETSSIALCAQAFPNPFADLLTLEHPSAAYDAASATIYDVAGRLVRTLAFQAGDTRIEWDGRTADGNSAEDGIYFIMFRGRNWASATKVVKLDQ